MPQNGVHALVGMASRKWMPRKEWLALGVVLGNMFPDLDNIVVAYATLAKLPDPEQYHRTFTHSIFTILAMLALFYLVTLLTKNEKWNNLGIGFGVGILMHILVDLVLWFNGVELLWPFGTELNFWAWFQTPAWLKILLDTGEFLAFGLYFSLLASLAARQGTDAGLGRTVRTLAYVEFGLFALFTVIFFAGANKGLPYQVFGVLYLLSLIVGMVFTVRLRATVESF